MPPKSRPTAKTADAEQSSETVEARVDAPPENGSGADVEGPAAGGEPGDGGTDASGTAEGARPGVYRFTWPYPCTYQLPDRTSTAVEPGTEVFWPDGAPDALWQFVSDTEPAPAPSDNTPRE